MAKTVAAKPAPKPAPVREVNYDTLRCPLFGELTDSEGNPILAKDVSTVLLSFNEPDERIPLISPQGGIRGGRIKVPNEFFDIANAGSGPAKFVFNPVSTTEADYEAHFGRGFYFIQPVDWDNQILAGRNMNLGGPRRFQGVIQSELPVVRNADGSNGEGDGSNNAPNNSDGNDDVIEAIEMLAKSQEETAQMFREALTKPAVPTESPTSRLREAAELAALFRPPVEAGMTLDANNRRIDDLMRDHRKDLERVSLECSELRTDYRNELTTIRKKFDVETDDLRRKYNKDTEESREDYRTELAARQKIFDENRVSLTKRIEELDRDLRDLRRESDKTISDLRIKVVELSNDVLTAELTQRNAEQQAEAANKDADDLEKQLRSTPAAASGPVLPSSVPGAPGWINMLLQYAPVILPAVLPMLAKMMMAQGGQIPSDMPPYLQEQLRAAMAAQQGPPPGFAQQGPPPGWVPIPVQQQGPPPGWGAPQQPPPGWGAAPQGPPPGWAPVPSYAPEPQQPFSGPTMQQQGFPQGPPQPFPFVGGPQQQPIPSQQEQEAWFNEQQRLRNQAPPQQPMIAVRTSAPIIEDEDDDDQNQGAPS